MTVEKVRQIVLDMLPDVADRLRVVAPAHLGFAEAAAYCGVSTRTIEYARRRNELRAVTEASTGTRGRKVLFTRDELDRWVRGRKKAALA